jgi:hypothetical protein
MPRVSAFYGVEIYMYYNDHAPPHFHAMHGDDEALMETVMALLRIKDVVPLTDHRLRLTLTDGTTVERDVDNLLVGPAFEAIRRDPALFNKARVEHGTVVWPGDVDLCPDVLIWDGPPPEDTANG